MNTQQLLLTCVSRALANKMGGPAKKLSLATGEKVLVTATRGTKQTKAREGGWTVARKPTKLDKKVLYRCLPDFKQQVGVPTKTKTHPTLVRTQVVNGLNYLFAVTMRKKWYHIQIYKATRGAPELVQWKAVSADTPLEPLK